MITYFAANDQLTKKVIETDLSKNDIVIYSSSLQELAFAVSKCATPYFTFFNPMDRWYSNKIEKSIKIFDRLPYCNAVYSDFDVFDTKQSKMLKSMTFSYDPRLSNKYNIMVSSVLFRNKCRINIAQSQDWEGDTYKDFTTHNFCYHIPEPLYVKRIK